MSWVVDAILYAAGGLLAGAVIGGVVAGVASWVMDRRAAAAGAARLRAQIERAHASSLRRRDYSCPCLACEETFGRYTADVEADDFTQWERELA